VPSALSDGGFAYLGADGRPMPDRQPSLLLTARMTHVSALGSVLGVPGSEHLLAHGMRSLMGPFHDERDGGWFSTLERGGRKAAYEHVHVLLGAASAMTAQSAGAGVDATSLVEEAKAIVEERFWREDEGALCESWSASWFEPEDYRGANANMHAVEAFLAIGDALDEDAWHARALRICERIVHGHARERGWLLPEHYDGQWRELSDYNVDDPDHPFRPYGATLGHAFEWARLLCLLHASPRVSRPEWLLESAASLSRRALSAWGIDGREGLPYTVDWAGRPVSSIRLHWPVCEGIQAMSLLHQLTGAGEWEAAYRRLWDHAARYFVDDATGAWINELDEQMREGHSMWPGRPDVYHATGAYTAPLAPPWPFVTVALARSGG
jgi:mannose/cellobiose epimerase-like protein (N-acyl-D-glucosamine 2-epimerase family)